MKLLAGHFEDGAAPSASVGAEFDGGFVGALEIQFGGGERVVQDIERAGAICFHVGEAMHGRAGAIEDGNQRGVVFAARAVDSAAKRMESAFDDFQAAEIVQDSVVAKYCAAETHAETHFVFEGFEGAELPCAGRPRENVRPRPQAAMTIAGVVTLKAAAEWVG